MRRNKKKEIE
jgi:hypothetical protein